LPIRYRYNTNTCTCSCFFAHIILYYYEKVLILKMLSKWITYVNVKCITSRYQRLSHLHWLLYFKIIYAYGLIRKKTKGSRFVPTNNSKPVLLWKWKRILKTDLKSTRDRLFIFSVSSASSQVNIRPIMVVYKFFFF